MKDAPFNVSMMFFAIYLGVAIAGAIIAVILKSLGLSGFWGIFLAAFLTVPLGGTIRSTVGRFFADESGHKGAQPFAFNLPIRLGIGAVVAALIAWLFSMSDFYSFGALVGGVAALLTGLIISLIFFLNVSMRK